MTRYMEILVDEKKKVIQISCRKIHLNVIVTDTIPSLNTKLNMLHTYIFLQDILK